MTGHIKMLADASAALGSVFGVRRAFFEISSDEGVVIMMRLVVYLKGNGVMTDSISLTSAMLEAMPDELIRERVDEMVSRMRKAILS